MELIDQLNRVAAEVTGTALGSFLVLIKEIVDENVGVGGVPLLR